MLKVIGTTDKPCLICMTEKQVVEAKFTDGLAGNFCWRDLWKMIDARSKYGKPAGSTEMS